MAKKVKNRNWSFLLYPESLPDDWLKQVKAWGIEVALSPVHDHDIYDSDSPADYDGEPYCKGELKKAHRHGIAHFPGPTTSNNFYENFLKPLNQPIPIPCSDVEVGLRYFIHEDDPDKFQYLSQDIVYLNGFNPLDFHTIPKGKEMELIFQVKHYITDNDIFEFCDFLNYLEFCGDVDAQYVGVHNKQLFYYFIASRRNKYNKKDSF